MPSHDPVRPPTVRSPLLLIERRRRKLWILGMLRALLKTRDNRRDPRDRSSKAIILVFLKMEPPPPPPPSILPAAVPSS